MRSATRGRELRDVHVRSARLRIRRGHASGGGDVVPCKTLDRGHLPAGAHALRPECIVPARHGSPSHPVAIKDPSILATGR
jgi:hypothetical protein